jgi:hypothetical protein
MGCWICRAQRRLNYSAKRYGYSLAFGLSFGDTISAIGLPFFLAENAKCHHMALHDLYFVAELVLQLQAAVARQRNGIWKCR